MKNFCFVNSRMSSLSMSPHLSEDLRDRAMESAVSDTMFEDCGGTRKKRSWMVCLVVPRRVHQCGWW